MTRMPEGVAWTVDGFSVDLVGRRYSERVAMRFALVCMVGVLAVATATLWWTDLASGSHGLDRLLPWAIRLLCTLGGVLGGALFMLFGSRRSRRLAVAGFFVVVGRERIQVGDLLGCEVRGDALVLRLRSGRRRILGAGLHVDELGWIRDRIAKVQARWRARAGPVPPEVMLLRER